MNEAMKPRFDALADELDRVCNGRPVLFLLNDGNWGDSLIREGSEAFFKSYGFRYYMVKVLDLQKKKVSLSQVKERLGHSDPVAVFNGGGSYDPRYGRLPFLNELAAQFSSILFLPSSYPPGMQQGFPKNAIFYARDKGDSFQNVGDARFCHDMAFFLNPVYGAPIRSVGLFMREDGERPEGAPIPPGNRDLSKEGRAHTPVKRFLAHLSRHEIIYTNRLHVCIGGAILGRRVHFFPNDYFKNQMVFDASLKPHFPKVSFENDYEELANITPELPSLQGRLARMLKLK